MPDKDAGKGLLENAYQLETPEDNVAYYASLAQSYDGDFAQGLGWEYPRSVAGAYRKYAGLKDLPVADIGCGTGFVAEYLGISPTQIDGVDISPEMLAIARGKSLYRRLYEVDLLGDLGPISNGYGAVLSAGTFTHGHLGPEPLRGLLSIARNGALFVIGVNSVHYAAKGFAAVVGDLQTCGAIGQVRTRKIKMYNKEGHEHSDDVANLLIYRKL